MRSSFQDLTFITSRLSKSSISQVIKAPEEWLGCSRKLHPHNRHQQTPWKVSLGVDKTHGTRWDTAWAESEGTRRDKVPAESWHEHRVKALAESEVNSTHKRCTITRDAPAANNLWAHASKISIALLQSSLSLAQTKMWRHQQSQGTSKEPTQLTRGASAEN